MPDTDGQGPVLGGLAAIRSELSALNAALEREHERAAFREDIIDRLHAENQQLRRSELEATLEPVRSALYRLYDLAEREADRWMAAGAAGAAGQAALRPDGTTGAAGLVATTRLAGPPHTVPDSSLFTMFSEQVGALFTAFAEEIADVLGRTGVEPFEVQPGEPYDAALHRPVDTVDVEDASWDGMVVETLSSGFMRGEQIVRRADVVVGQLVAP